MLQIVGFDGSINGLPRKSEREREWGRKENG